ncbi:unnamed protein product [Sphagnum jensenii]|uniref:DNA repair metallo-beta-lactamase domain-containing protein n=1 Tax=Sphagnum jensenii TaxID=128206 RepID=A0ABP0VEU9_9BRYO
MVAASSAKVHIMTCLEMVQRSSKPPTCFFCDRWIGLPNTSAKFNHLLRCAELKGGSIDVLLTILSSCSQSSTVDLTDELQPPCLDVNGDKNTPTALIPNAFQYIMDNSKKLYSNITSGFVSKSTGHLRNTVEPSKRRTVSSASPLPSTSVKRARIIESTPSHESAATTFSNTPHTLITFEYGNAGGNGLGVNPVNNCRNSREPTTVSSNISWGIGTSTSTSSSGSSNSVCEVSVSNSSNGKDNKNKYIPACKLIHFPVRTMTHPIVVDGFQYAKEGLSQCYFLTHFHSDHYTGLRKGFKHGRIYCTETTARLTTLRLGVPADQIISLSLNVQEVVLHTGDFRYSPDMLIAAVLKKVDEEVRAAQDSGQKVVFVFGAYGIGKERVYTSVAHHLKAKVYFGFILAFNSVNFPAMNAMRESFHLQVPDVAVRMVGFLPTGWSHKAPKSLKRSTSATSNSASNAKLSSSETGKLTLISTLFKSLSGNTTISDFSSQEVCVIDDDSEASEDEYDGCESEFSTPATMLAQIKSAVTPADSSSAVRDVLTEDENIMTCKRLRDDCIYSVPYSEHSSFTELVDFIRTFR